MRKNNNNNGNNMNQLKPVCYNAKRNAKQLKIKPLWLLLNVGGKLKTSMEIK